MIVMFIV